MEYELSNGPHKNISKTVMLTNVTAEGTREMSDMSSSSLLNLGREHIHHVGHLLLHWNRTQNFDSVDLSLAVND